MQDHLDAKESRSGLNNLAGYPEGYCHAASGDKAIRKKKEKEVFRRIAQHRYRDNKAPVQVPETCILTGRREQRINNSMS